MVAARAGIGHREVEVAGELPLNAQVVLHDVGRLQVEVDRLQLRGYRAIRVEIRHDVGERRIGDRSTCRERRIQAPGKEVVFGEDLVVENPEARAHGGLAILERVPGDAYARREV